MRFALPWVLFAFAVGACDCGQSPVSLARLVERSGKVVRDSAQAPESWSPAVVGAAFGLGDGVWLDGQGTAVLELAAGQRLAMKPNTIIRFSAAQEKSQFQVEAGEAVLTVFDQAMSLRTEFGLALIDANSRVRLTRDGQQQLFAVELGSARFTGGDDDGIVALVGNAVLMTVDGPTLLTSQQAQRVLQGQQPPTATPATTVYEVDIATAGAKARSLSSTKFEELSVGSHQVPVGTVLRLPSGSSATVRRGGETVVASGAGDFELGGDSGAEVRASGGRLRVSTHSRPVLIEVPGGAILIDVADGGSEANVRFDGAGTRVDVVQGIARLKYGAQEVLLEEGMSGTVPPVDAMVNSVEALGDPGPARADFSVPAGESFVVHAATLPLVVGLETASKCKGGAVVKVGQGQRVRGKHRVNMSLGQGRVSYGVYCIEGDRLGKRRVAHGVVTVLRDTGTRELPKTPPDARVDTDGLRYTVIYQNQPPTISVRWPNAANATAYVLQVTGSRGEQRFEAPQARKDFGSGALHDGVHQLVFETSHGKRSPRTTLEIRFDNAASTASVSSPRESGFTVGETVSVSGVALRGWKVAVEGGTMEIDRQRRFRGEVKTSEAHPNVAIRLSHARRGVHYYLRRAAARE